MKTEEIREELERLHAAIGRADGAAISAATRRLDELLAAHQAELPARLAHFLAQRSYAKALAWLGGGTPASGACSPHSQA